MQDQPSNDSNWWILKTFFWYGGVPELKTLFFYFDAAIFALTYFQNHFGAVSNFQVKTHWQLRQGNQFPTSLNGKAFDTALVMAWLHDELEAGSQATCWETIRSCFYPISWYDGPCDNLTVAAALNLRDDPAIQQPTASQSWPWLSLVQPWALSRWILGMSCSNYALTWWNVQTISSERSGHTDSGYAAMSAWLLGQWAMRWMLFGLAFSSATFVWLCFRPRSFLSQPPLIWIGVRNM